MVVSVTWPVQNLSKNHHESQKKGAGINKETQTTRVMTIEVPMKVEGDTYSDEIQQKLINIMLILH